MESIKKKTFTVLRYVAFGVVIGVLVGAIDTLFGRVLIAITDFRTDYYIYLLPFLPVAGLLITWMYNKFSAVSLKGMSLVFETGQSTRDSIPLPLVPLVMVGTWITHLFGGSAGREGVAVQIGATLSHRIGKKFRFSNNERVLLITGMAAGFGGLFQTPLGAVFFALEVIVAGYLEYEALLPAFIASMTACFTSHTLGLEKFTVNVTDTLDLTNYKVIICLVIMGITFGFVGRLFSYLLQKSKDLMKNKIKNSYIRIGVVSIPLAVILIVFYGGRYSGLGTNLISSAFNGGDIYYYDWIVKLLLTIITLAIGFQGGEVTPLFSIGATLGIVLGDLFGISPVVCGAIGYVAVFGSATNTLIAPMLLGVEVFGVRNTLPIVIVCIIAYIVNGNLSIYSSQQKALFGFEK